MKTIILLSGGIDSATVLAEAVNVGNECFALGVDYGQSHFLELDRAQALAEHYKVPFEIAITEVIPRVSDVVFAGRNLVLVSLAVAKAQEFGFDNVAVGCNKTDWELFPDCRQDFWVPLSGVIGRAYGVYISAPLVGMTKKEVVAYARTLGVPLEQTWSCYDPQDDQPCGECLACKVRADAMA